MQEIFLSFSLWELSFLFCGVFLFYIYFLRNQIFYWFDPLLIFIFFNSISIAFVIYLYLFEKSIKLDYLISFSLSIFAFILGVLYGGKGGLPRWKISNQDFQAQNVKKYSSLVDIFMLVCLTIMISSNLLMLFIKGTLPILSADPSEAKIILYTGGWGIVKRINLSLLNFVLAIPLIKIFHPTIKIRPKKKFLYFTCLLMGIVVMISMGNKSSLLILLNMLFAITIFNRISGSLKKSNFISFYNVKKLLQYAKYTFVCSVLVMFLIIVLSSVGRPTSSSTFDALTTRLIATGDLFYFFYVYDLGPIFDKNPLDYIPHILNPLIGMFRLGIYEFPIGVQTMYYSVGLQMDEFATFGPNAQHPVEGLIYFGKIGSPFYSFFIGYLISYIRIIQLRKYGPFPNYLKMLAYVILSSIILIAGTDFPLFAQVLYDEVIYGGILLFLSLIISEVLNIKHEG